MSEEKMCPLEPGGVFEGENCLRQQLAAVTAERDEWEAIAVNLSRRLPNDGNGAAWWIDWARAEIKKKELT